MMPKGALNSETEVGRRGSRGQEPTLPAAILSAGWAFPPPLAGEEAKEGQAQPVPRVNGDAAEQIQFGVRFKSIEPLVNPERFPDLHRRFPRKEKLKEYLASQSGISVRTLERREANWIAGAHSRLIRKIRDDKGISRARNTPSDEFLLRAFCPEDGIDGRLRVAEVFRAYEEEREWREAYIGKVVPPHSREALRNYIGPDGCLLPSCRLPKLSPKTLYRFSEQLSGPIKSLAADGTEAYRNSQEIISHRDIAADCPMDVCVMDHRRCDVFVMVKDGTGWKLVRPWLTAAIDSRTRRWLAWAVMEVPSSDSIATVLRRVFLNFGLPKICYWDRGRDFMAQWFEGVTRRERRSGRIAELTPTWRGVMGALGVRVTHALPYNARAKCIEPNFNRISNIDRALPWWVGNSSAKRPERIEKLLEGHERWIKGEVDKSPFPTIEEFTTLYSRAIHDLNERPLQGEGMRVTTPTGYGWATPNQSWETLIGRVERRNASAEVLQMCFAKRKTMTVQHGEISTTIDGRLYHYRMADNSLRLMWLNGKAVELAFDPNDMGEAAIYFQSSGPASPVEFFGLARCVELRRAGEKLFVEDEKSRRVARRQINKVLTAIHERIPQATFEERLTRREEIRPRRAEVPQIEAPAAIAPPILAAAEAARAAAMPSEPVSVARIERPAEPEDDGAFDFFGGTRT